MNSLLQTLYMTPEFKQKLYHWSYEESVDGPKTECIPFQLQKLFGRLDLMLSEAVGTKALTTSFGWLGNQAFEQHDVQELCRVLFEALDKSFVHRMLNEEMAASYSGVSLVSELYEGMMTGYIDCQECEYVSARHEKFLDIQVPIQGLPSVSAGLQAFVTPERMEGENQYACSGCSQKVDALKGMSIKQVPYLLALQLSRFAFDYMTMSRVKVHDFITFPDTLNMSPFLAPDSAQAESGTPVTYKLYSILIHAGGAMGGHYYAYVYSFAKDAWFNFNDTKVSPATDEMLAAVGLEEAIARLQKQEGDAPSPLGEDNNSSEDNGPPPSVATSSSSSSSEPGMAATAYMLMYRRIDESENLVDLGKDAIPEVCVEDAAKENALFEEHRAKVEYERNMRKLRVYYEDQAPMLRVHSSKTLGEALEEALVELGIAEDTPRECVRLRAYNSFTKTPGEVYKDHEGSTLEELLFPAMKALLLEVREVDGEFPEEVDDSLTLQVAMLSNMDSVGAIEEDDYATNFFTPLQTITVSRGDTLDDLKNAMAAAHESGALDPAAIQLVTIDLARGVARILDGTASGEGDDAKSGLFARYGLDNGSCVYAEPVPGTEGDSVIVRRFDYEQNLMEVCFNLPTAADAPAGTQVEYDQVVTFDKRKTLAELKAEGIAPILGLEVSEFKLCRNLLSKEYKNEDATLEACGIFDGSAVYVALGAPMKADEHKIRVFVYSPEYSRVLDESVPEGGDTGVTQGDGGLASKGDIRESRRFSPLLMELIVSKGVTVDELRAQILDRLVSLEVSHEMHVAAKDSLVSGGFHARLRERVNHRAGGVLLGHKSLEDSLPGLKDRHSIALQPVEVEEKTSVDHVLLRVQRWNPSTWSAEPVQDEMVLDSAASVGELKLMLSARVDIPVEHLQVAKPLIATTQSDLQDAVLDLQWGLSDVLSIGDSPLLVRDGVLILFRDGREEGVIPKEVLERRPKEQGIRIRTRYDDDYESAPASDAEGGDGGAKGGDGGAKGGDGGAGGGDAESGGQQGDQDVKEGGADTDVDATKE